MSYTAEAPTGPLASGTLVFQPGETVKPLPLAIPNPQGYELLSVSLSNPKAAELTGLGQVLALGTNATPAAAILIPFGTTWRYRDNGVSQGTAWIPAAFNDDNWSSGAATFGYNSGNTGLATVLGFGPDSTNKYRTYYFRKQFIVESVAAFTNLFLEVLRDDGLVVYLNGQDFYRNNLPAGPLAYSDFATNATDNGGIIQSATLPLTALVMGANVLAAEVHQSSASSSDLAFDLQLTAIPTSSSLLLQQARLGGQLVLYWNDSSYELEEAAEISGPWTPMFGSTTPQAIHYSGSQRFFRLRKRETLWWPPSQRRHVAPVPPEGESSLRTKESFANLLQRHSL